MTDLLNMFYFSVLWVGYLLVFTFCVTFLCLQQLLNHCFDDIEKFIRRLQSAAEAYRELDSRRKQRVNKRNKHPIGGMLTCILFSLFWQTEEVRKNSMRHFIVFDFMPIILYCRIVSCSPEILAPVWVKWSQISHFEICIALLESKQP